MRSAPCKVLAEYPHWNCTNRGQALHQLPWTHPVQEIAFCKGRIASHSFSGTVLLRRFYLCRSSVQRWIHWWAEQARAPKTAWFNAFIHGMKKCHLDSWFHRSPQLSSCHSTRNWATQNLTGKGECSEDFALFFFKVFIGLGRGCTQGLLKHRCYSPLWEHSGMVWEHIKNVFIIFSGCSESIGGCSKGAYAVVGMLFLCIGVCSGSIGCHPTPWFSMFSSRQWWAWCHDVHFYI